MARILLILTALVLTACAAGKPIEDYSKRSTYYTWVDVSQVSGNSLQWFVTRNLAAPKDERYYAMSFEKLGDGYLIWHNGVIPGRYEFANMTMMTCLGAFCSNTRNEFEFGQLGTAPGQVKVGNPGVHFAGCFAFVQTKRGFFRPGEFDTKKVACKMTQNQMLSAILKHAPEGHPVVAQRIQRAMGR